MQNVVQEMQRKLKRLPEAHKKIWNTTYSIRAKLGCYVAHYVACSVDSCAARYVVRNICVAVYAM